MTPHISAKQGDFADIALMPGDPLRAKYIAENFLQNAKEITNVRNMFGFTGEYKGRKVSIMGHGMGIPSCSIYATELIKFYGVKKIIRVGSCGGVSDKVKIRDVIIALGASTDSNVNRQRFNNYDLSCVADFQMAMTAYNEAQQKNISVKVGSVFTSDFFYNPDESVYALMERYGILGVEMEAAGFYGVATEYGARVLTICTVSDHLKTKEALSAEDRQKTFNDMIDLALDTIVIEN